MEENEDDDHIAIWPVVAGLVGSVIVCGGMVAFILIASNS